MAARSLLRELRRLILQVERDLLAKARFRALLTAASDTVAGHREELRSVKAEMIRARQRKEARKTR